MPTALYDVVHGVGNASEMPLDVYKNDPEPWFIEWSESTPSRPMHSQIRFTAWETHSATLDQLDPANCASEEVWSPFFEAGPAAFHWLALAWYTANAEEVDYAGSPKCALIVEQDGQAILPPASFTLGMNTYYTLRSVSPPGQKRLFRFRFGAMFCGEDWWPMTLLMWGRLGAWSGQITLRV